MFSWLTKQTVYSVIEEAQDLLMNSLIISINQENTLKDIDKLFYYMKKTVFALQKVKEKSDTTDAQREQIEKLENQLMGIRKIPNHLRRCYGNN